MMLYDMTVPYRAERIKTADEQRRADEQLGMMAAEVYASGGMSSARPFSAPAGSEPGQLLIEPAGGGRAPVDRVGQLGPDDRQALSLYRGALARWQGQHRLQGRDRGVERAGPHPRDGRVGVREHLALSAVVLAWACRPAAYSPIAPSSSVTASSPRARWPYCRVPEWPRRRLAKALQ